MPNFIHEEITQYRATIRTYFGDKRASINLLTENCSIYISFYKEEAVLPDNRSPIIMDRQHVYLSYYYHDYANIIDLLRNEKPVKVFYRDDAKFGYISTAMEPVGEHELEL